MVLKRIKGIIFFFLYLVLLNSCNDDETQKLIVTSISTGNLLSAYYDDLIKFTIETWEMAAFNSSLREVEFHIELQNDYQKTIEHLESRKRMVDSFTKLLPVFEQFVKNKND